MATGAGLRRIVTGDAGGRSVIAIDSGPAKEIFSGEGGLAEIWEALLQPGAILAGLDRLSTADLRLEPAQGAVKVRWFSIGAEAEIAPRPEADEMAKAVFGMVGAAHCLVDATRHPMMHKTDSLDVIILVKGEVDLLLDEGEAKAMKPGDVVIQRATNHAWVNTGKETALLVAVLIDAGAAHG